MEEKRLDIAALVAALDAQRDAKEISWRELARQSGVSASTLTRMQQGKLPDVNTFGALVEWLGLPADRFLTKKGETIEPEAHPLAVASTLLRGRKDMSPEAVKALEELVRAAFKLAKELE